MITRILLLFQDEEPLIRSQTVVLRRLSNAEKNENIEVEEKDFLETQQAIQGQIMSRSKTVLLKSADHKDQENKLRYVHLLCLHFFFCYCCCCH